MRYGSDIDPLDTYMVYLSCVRLIVQQENISETLIHQDILGVMRDIRNFLRMLAVDYFTHSNNG